MRVPLGPHPVGRSWLWLVGATLLSVACSSHPERSWLALPIAIAYLAITWTCGHLLRRQEWRQRWLTALFWGLVPWVLVGIAVVFAGWHAVIPIGPGEIRLGTEDGRLNSVFFHPNVLAGYLMLIGPLATTLWPRRPWRTALAFGILGLGLLLTRSRSAWIGAAAVLPVLLVLRHALVPARERQEARKTTLVILGVLAACLLLSLPIWAPRLHSVIEPGVVSNEGHRLVWAAAMDMVQARPWTGWGPGTWPVIYPRFRYPDEFEHLSHAHSVFLHLAAEYGLPMLVAFILMVLSVIRRAVEVVRQGPDGALVAALASGVVGYLVMGVFEFTLAEGRNSILFFSELGLLLALTHAPAEGRDPPRPPMPADASPPPRSSFP
ncbi:MAG: O-antigen ligase family protein [Candidatus Sericytochromatia bacterium]|nr:O-antigen ligase family protein [Candidatus Sericytochromatia bacterium]